MKKGGKKTMSLKQLAANRNNAQKSTGPKTAAGKAVAKLNAVKHGLLSAEVLVQGLHYTESPYEFRAYRLRFWQELAPVGPLEEILVDEIVTNRWRQRRILIAESGEIALSVEGGWRWRNDDNLATNCIVWKHAPDMFLEMEKSTDGIHHLTFVLKALLDAVQKDGQLTEDALNWALDHFGKKPNCLTNTLAEFCKVLKENPVKLDAAALLKQHREQVLDYIERTQRSLAWRLYQVEKREEKEEEAQQDASVLPPAEKLDKILRYETALDRQFYRAMAQLERLQRMRSGEQVPPPFSMEISPKC